MWDDGEHGSVMRGERNGIPVVLASVEEVASGRWACRVEASPGVLAQVRARREADGLYRSPDAAKRAAETKLRAGGVKLRDLAPPALVCVSTRIRPELRDRLLGEAKARGISFAAVLMQAIEFGAP